MTIEYSPSSDTKNTMVGVVGGGQLAQMLVEAGQKRGIEVAIQTFSKSDPAAIKAKKVIEKDQKDFEATRELSKICKTITFENEWIEIDSLRLLEEQGTSFVPNLISLMPLIDKISQRKLLRKLNILGPDWMRLSILDSNDQKLPDGWSFPLMAKASKGGYDGKGTKIIKDFSALKNLINSVDNENWFLENWVNYKKEYSLIASRDFSGKIRSFPLIETSQKNQVCDWALSPANVTHSIELMAQNVISSIMTELNYYGVLAIEFFFGDQGLMVNEIAPRTHNSGHFSIEACNSSQFDQQVCIAAGLDVPSPELISKGALMVNLLGLPSNKYSTINKRLGDISSIEGANVHWYEKQEEKVGRKMGHVTFLLNGEDHSSRRDEAMALKEKIRKIWPIN